MNQITCHQNWNMSSQKLTLKVKKNIVWTLHALLSKSFGTQSEKTLLCTSTGKVRITNDGMTILNSLNLSHPVARLVLQAIRKHHAYSKDGVKTFLMYLSEVMNIFEKHQIEPSAGYKQLVKIEKDILPIVFNELTKICIQDKSNVLDVVRSVACTTLGTQLTRQQTDICSLLLMEVLTKDNSGNCVSLTAEVISQRVKFIIENFSFLHLKVAKHYIDSSANIPGILLRRNFDIKMDSLKTKGNLKYVLLLCAIEGILNHNSDEIVFLKDESGAQKAFTARKTHTKMFLTVLKDLNVSLIICSERVPDFVLSMCREFGISVVSFVDEEDIHFLEKISQTQAISSPLDPIEVKHIGELSSIDNKVIGQQRFVQLMFPQDVAERISGTVLIAAPTDGMVDDLVNVFFKALKSVEMCFSPMDRDHLGTSFTGQEELDQNPQPSMILTTVGGGAHFELQCAHLLKKVSNNFTDLETGFGCRLVHDSLLTVPRALHKNLWRTKSTESKEYLKKLQMVELSLKQEKCVGFNGFGRLCDPREAGILEPLESKMAALSSVLQLLKQLMRIDSVVSIRRLHEDLLSDSD